jgi:hypothetical protein
MYGSEYSLLRELDCESYCRLTFLYVTKCTRKETRNQQQISVKSLGRHCRLTLPGLYVLPARLTGHNYTAFFWGGGLPVFIFYFSFIFSSYYN